MDFSFDIVSKVDFNEVTNAVNQAMKEITTRYDFKGSQSSITQEKEELVVFTEDDFRLKNVLDILLKRFSSRGIPLKNLTYKPIEQALGGCVRQRITLQQGIPQDIAKEVVRIIKDGKFKVQASIQGDQVRVSSKSKDELQAVMAALKGGKINLDLQFTNYR